MTIVNSGSEVGKSKRSLKKAPLYIPSANASSRLEALLAMPGYVEMEKRLYQMMREEIQRRVS